MADVLEDGMEYVALYGEKDAATAILEALPPAGGAAADDDARLGGNPRWGKREGGKVARFRGDDQLPAMRMCTSGQAGWRD